MSDARQFFNHPKPFVMHRGGELPGFTLAYETWGRLSSAGDNALLVFTGLSPDAHVASNQDNPKPGWWEFMVGKGKPIDTDRWFVICVNSLGSCKGSTGPASEHDGKVLAADFPELALEDVASTTKLLLAELGVDQLKCLVGPSMGGMTALAFVLQFPGCAQNLVSISSTAAAPPFAIAIRSLQREAIRKDPHYAGGRYHDGPGPIQGMRLARKLGVISYRSALEWRDRFKRDRISPERASDEPFGAEFEVESYLEAHADRFVNGFDPNCYIYLSRAMDWFDAGDYGPSVKQALSTTQLDSALVIGVETDLLFPLELQQQIAADLAAAGTTVEFHRLASIQGHDAFLVDQDRFGPAVADYLAKLD